MATATSDSALIVVQHFVPESRVAFFGTWELFEALTTTLERQRVRVAFDGERIELMIPSQDHDEATMRVCYMVPMIAGALGVVCKGILSTTQKQPPSRGVEPDTSFYMTRNKAEAAATRRRGHKPDPSAPPGPVPDLAVEIDMSPSSLDRPLIYAALGVPEVWRYNGERVVIERLTPEGVYESVPESGWLEVRPHELVQLINEVYVDDNEFMDRVKAWARDVLQPRHQAR
jgi:Uma2 family endonuclease